MSLSNVHLWNFEERRHDAAKFNTTDKRDSGELKGK